MGANGSMMSSQRRARGWNLGCCAATDFDDEDFDGSYRAGPVNNSICFDQPLPIHVAQQHPVQHIISSSISRMHTRVASSFSLQRSNTAQSTDQVNAALPELRAPTVPPLVHTRPSTAPGLIRKPTLSRPSFSLRRSNTSRSVRPSIGAPTDFRRVDSLLGVSSDFKPIALSVALPDGRLSPMPDFTEMQLISKRESTLSCNVTDFEKKLLAGSFAVPMHIGEDKQTILPNEIARHGASQVVHTSSAQQKMEQLLDDLKGFGTPVGPTVRPRSNTEPVRMPKRKRSGLLQKDKTDVDDAIRELEAIVEERRAGNQLSIADPTRRMSRKHIPAIAPAMAMRVRTKTLSDIGSAFSRPFSNDFNEPDSPTLGVEFDLAPLTSITTPKPLPFQTHKRSPSSNSANSRTTRLMQVTKWLSSSRTSTIGRSSPECIQDREDHDPQSSTRSIDQPKRSNGLHQPYAGMTLANRSSDSLASIASSTSTISTSRFPTAPTTPPLSRSASQATQKSGKLRVSHEHTSPPMPSADENRWITTVGMAA